MINLSPQERDVVAGALAVNRTAADSVHGKSKPRIGTAYERYGKRAIDIAISAVALVVTAPVNAMLAIGAYIDVGKPILFRQERAGKDGVPFVLIKFRNMTNDVDERGELLPQEQRVTKWGSFVRATSLDELLNFWSVFKGDMSIIGPRPLLVEYTDRYCEYHRSRLSVRPGLECPPDPKYGDAQNWEGHLNNDVWYAENISFANDVKKFIRLVESVFDRKSAAVRGSATRSFFMGYGKNGLAMSLTDLDDNFIERAIGEGNHD